MRLTSLFFGVNRLWKEKVEALKSEIQKLEGEKRKLEEKIAPIKQQIKSLIAQIEPVESKILDIDKQIRELSWQLKRAEKELFVESLNVGSELWIVYSRYYQFYHTISEEDAKRRLSVRAPGTPVPRLVRIVEVRERNGRKSFIAESVEGRKRFVGVIYRASEESPPEIHWYKRVE